MPAVSICIPTYKQTQYLEKCLQSVLIQDFKDYELIITDDTPDDSIEVFIRSILGDTPYRYERNSPALGPPENWNAGIRTAKGRYIKVLHHDDFFTRPDSLRLMVEALEEKRASFLFCQTDVWHVTTGVHRIHAISSKQLRLLKQKPEFLFFKNMIGSPSATLYKNKLYDYDPRFKWLVDIELYLKFLLNSHTIAYLAAPLICTAHDTAEQVTGHVINDKHIQIKEHVLLFNIIKSRIRRMEGFSSFFDQLFYAYGISEYSDLEEIVPEAAANKPFFEAVISDLPKNRFWKRLENRLWKRIGEKFFKMEQYL